MYDNPEFWKSLGIIVTPIIGIVGAVLAVIKISINNNTKLIEERYKNKLDAKLMELDKLYETSKITFTEITNLNKTEMNWLKNEMNHYNTGLKEKMNNFCEEVKNNMTDIKKEVDGLFFDHMKRVTDIFEETKDMIDNLNGKFTTSIKNIDDKVNYMNNSIDDLHKKISDMEVAKIARREFIGEMDWLLNNALQFMSREIKPFALYKGTKFIEFCMEIREYDFSNKDINYNTIINKGNTISDAVKQHGYILMGKEFVDIFYKEHNESVKRFLNTIVETIKVQADDKKYRFQTQCMSFMNEFMKVLNDCYIANKSVVVFNDSDDFLISAVDINN